MGKRTILAGENMTLGTGNVLAGFQTAAAGNAASLVFVTRIDISQSGTNSNSQIRAAFSKRDTAGTLTLTSVTPQMLYLGGSASGLSGNINILAGAARSGVNSSADTGGTYTDIIPSNFSNLNGLTWKPDYDEQIRVPASTIFVVRLLAAPSTLTGWTVALYLDEMG